MCFNTALAHHGSYSGGGARPWWGLSRPAATGILHERWTRVFRRRLHILGIFNKRVTRLSPRVTLLSPHGFL